MAQAALSASKYASNKEIQEVMNLPDNLDGRKKEGGSSPVVNLNSDIINDMKKKNLLNRLNSKFQAAGEMAQKPAHELHEMKLMVPAEENEQRHIDDDEFNDLLNEVSSKHIVQPGWNVSNGTSSGGLRET